ncbi:MAG: DNA replication/repair protein RecF [Pseudomonadota bacterium]|nr:DNA replication/repair protein RecF [Pseudomonadota bacterium]
MRKKDYSLAEAAMKSEDYAAAAPCQAPAGAHARFRRLRLTDFRSYARADIALDGRPVVLIGANGAGKTNVLEAVSLLGPGRGLRGSRLDELPRVEGGGGWAVAAQIESAGDERHIGVGATAADPSRRLCRIDEASASGPAAFADVVRFMWLTPAQDRLFMDGPGERRRFLDRIAVALNPDQARAGADYELAMRQRQRLLDERSRDDAWISALETQMAEAGVAIAAARREAAGALVAAEIDAAAGFPAAEIALEGMLEAGLASAPAAEVEEEFLTSLRRHRAADAAAGRALVGPHRSDLIVTHRQKGRPARLCSTGEQKALLIGLVLAAARSLALQGRFRGGAPAPLVLLLDEIAAHLDEGRRAALFDILGALGFQVFMTGTDKSLFSAWGSRAQAFAVEGGSLNETTVR